jgi:hypothetical protein
MTAEVMSHIFDPSTPLKSAVMDRFGTVIVSQIVAEHGGVIDVGSELGKEHASG